MNSSDDAAQALQDFANGPAIVAADDVAKAFEFAGERISLALERAAKSGELSFSSLAESVARDLARLAITELFTGPLQQAIGGLGKVITGANSKPAVTVNMSVSGLTDAQSFTKSQGQISSAVARAVADGQRYI
ncbi:hypothetical protein N9W89_06710 [Hellea sp.]|nr:hypothetical protein [Hellea sp.]